MKCTSHAPYGRGLSNYIQVICVLVIYTFLSRTGLTTHAQESLEDRIPQAIEALKTYSTAKKIPMSYIRHDLLEMIPTMKNKKKQTILKMLNMERELELIEAYDKPVWFEVEGTTAYMYGKIYPGIYKTVTTLFTDHPNLTKIVLIYVPGSHDDFENFKTIQYIRTKNIILEIGPKGFIASGGVDFLLAGTRRNIYKGASIGVHSRRYDGIKDANQLTKQDDRHTPWTKFYESIGIPPSYYRFVLDNATADEVHWLTEQELIDFTFVQKILPAEDFE